MIQVIQFRELNQYKKSIQQQSLRNEYDAVYVCINPVKNSQETRSAIAYERPAFAYMIISPLINFKPITYVRHNSDLSDFENAYTSMRRGQARSHLVWQALFTHTQTDT